MNEKKFSIKNRLQSFKHAFNGFVILLKEEHNSRVHIFAAFLVLVAGIVLEISKTEWYIVIILIGLVISMELLNSAIENLCDLVSPEYNDFIRKAKDLAAAAVLTCAGIAVILGCFIFIPKIFNLIDSI